MRRHRNSASRLRTAVELLPRHTREGMLRGIDSNTIIVGGYTDGNGGICPMLAAHRNGGRTSFAGFARAWDAFTGAGKRPRRASRREIRALRTYLEMSLLEDDIRIPQAVSLTAIAADLRAERREMALRSDPAPAAEPDSAAEELHREETDRPDHRFRIRDLRRPRRPRQRIEDLLGDGQPTAPR